MPRTPIRVAAVDGPDQDHLTAVRVFDWDRTFDLVPPTHEKWPILKKRLGLSRYPDRWVDCTDRPDVAEGTPFPFQAKRED